MVPTFKKFIESTVLVDGNTMVNKIALPSGCLQVNEGNVELALVRSPMKGFDEVRNLSRVESRGSCHFGRQSWVNDVCRGFDLEKKI